MKAECKIKKQIILDAMDDDYLNTKCDYLLDTEEQILKTFDMLNGEWGLQDIISDWRRGTEETDIECDWSRHYESKSVATKLSDGSWVGWTYWYGGGKHGEPEAIDWMKNAYYLNVTEKEVMITVREFSKIDD